MGTKNSRALKRLLDPQTYLPNLLEDSETCSTNSTINGTKVQCVKLLKVPLLFEEGQRPGSHREWPSSRAQSVFILGTPGILQTVAVVTHHNEATEQQGKTTSRERLAFSFQNKMGSISGQGSIYHGSYLQSD